MDFKLFRSTPKDSPGHSEDLLRYLSSMPHQVGRNPNLLRESNSSPFISDEHGSTRDLVADWL
jgi:hypothetical protein